MLKLLEEDLRTVELYRDFLPKRIFDAHAHLYAEGTVPELYDPKGLFCLREIDADTYKDAILPFFPGVEKIELMAMPMPTRSMNDNPELRERANLHVMGMAARGECVGGIYITPRDSEERIEQLATSAGVGALKCYAYSSLADDLEATLPADFLPEAAWRVAERHSMPIILHLFRTEALSDPINFEYVTKMASRYPNARLVLAHCARAFSARTAMESVRGLAPYENIYFDTAAICESAPIMACIKYCGADRVMFGTDFPIYPRGRAVSVGLGSHWLTGAMAPRAARPVIMLAEQLMALRYAAMLLELDSSDVEKIFYKNAERVFSKNT